MSHFKNQGYKDYDKVLPCYCVNTPVSLLTSHHHCGRRFSPGEKTAKCCSCPGLWWYPASWRGAEWRICGFVGQQKTQLKQKESYELTTYQTYQLHCDLHTTSRLLAVTSVKSWPCDLVGSGNAQAVLGREPCLQIAATFPTTKSHTISCLWFHDI